MSAPTHPYSFDNLYRRQKAQSARPFCARGVAVSRCEHCQIAKHACICSYTPRVNSRADFILLMHSDEVFKPTNTGRLISRAFGEQTYAFCWHRLEPDTQLIAMLNDPQRACYIVFPKPEGEDPSNDSRFYTQLPEPLIQNQHDSTQTKNANQTAKKLTFILLDGTWRQSSRMLRLSRWLDTTPCFSIMHTEKAQGQYAVRKAPQNNQLATAQAAALCLEQAKDPHSAALLSAYFNVFNQHYVATRMNTQPQQTQDHYTLLAHNSSS